MLRSLLSLTEVPKKKLAPSPVENRVVLWPARPSPRPPGNTGCWHRSCHRPAELGKSFRDTWRRLGAAALLRASSGGCSPALSGQDEPSGQHPCRAALLTGAAWGAPANGGRSSSKWGRSTSKQGKKLQQTGEEAPAPPEHSTASPTRAFSCRQGWETVTRNYLPQPLQP